MDVGAAIAYIDDVIRADLRAGLQLIEDKDFAVTGVGASDGVDLARAGVEKFGAIDMVSRNDAFERRPDDFYRGRACRLRINVLCGRGF